jgi:hypothetical protein
MLQSDTNMFSSDNWILNDAAWDLSGFMVDESEFPDVLETSYVSIQEDTFDLPPLPDAFTFTPALPEVAPVIPVAPVKVTKKKNKSTKHGPKKKRKKYALVSTKTLDSVSKINIPKSRKKKTKRKQKDQAYWKTPPSFLSKTSFPKVFVVPTSRSIHTVRELADLPQVQLNAVNCLWPLTGSVRLGKKLYRVPTVSVVSIYNSAGHLITLQYLPELNIFRTASSMQTDFNHLFAQKAVRDAWPRAAKPPPPTRLSGNSILHFYPDLDSLGSDLGNTAGDWFPWSFRSLNKHDLCKDIYNYCCSSTSPSPLIDLYRQSPSSVNLGCITPADVKESLKVRKAFNQLNWKKNKNGENPCTCKSFLFVFYYCFFTFLFTDDDCTCSAIIQQMFDSCGGKQKFQELSAIQASKLVWTAAMQDVMKDTPLIAALGSFAESEKKKFDAGSCTVYLPADDSSMTFQALESALQE